MTVAITNTERYRIFAGYHHDIFSAIDKNQFQRAMRLLFELAEDYCQRHESDVAALSEKYRPVIDGLGDDAPDTLSFLQAFHKLLIAMEDDVLSGFPSEIVQDSSPAVAEAVPQSKEPVDTPVDLKKALLLRSSESERPLVQLTDVTITFGKSSHDFKLGPVSLQVPQGQIVGVVGPNGSGKTTLLRLIAADLMQSSGVIDFTGIDSNRTGSRRPKDSWPAVRSKIAYVPPSPSPISENTELTLWITGATHGISSSQLEHQISVAMHKYGLSQYSNKLVSDLSTGYRLRFELARVLFTRASLLVLDEPLANLDHNAQLTVLEDLKMLSASIEIPRSIVVSSQHIEQVASISDYLVFLADGKILFKGAREEVPNALNYAIFEISVKDRLDELDKLLLQSGAIETDRTAVSIFALFAKGADSAMLMNSISRAGLRVIKFRDLSDSVEMMLLLPRFRIPHDSVAPSSPREQSS
jgi:ABC-2 type transport system ATP-binding protein